MKILAEVAAIIASTTEAKLLTELEKIVPIKTTRVQGSIAVAEVHEESDALHLRRHLKTVAAIAKNCWLDRILICWPGCGTPWPISASMAGNHHLESLPTGDYFIPELKLTWSDFYRNNKPIYIKSMAKTVLFANEAALEAQQKSLSQFVGESVYLLNHAEELDRRVELILAGQLDNQLYEYEAFRWFRTPQGYRRKVMDFASFFGKIEWCGEECWYSAPQDVVEKGAIV